MFTEDGVYRCIGPLLIGPDPCLTGPLCAAPIHPLDPYAPQMYPAPLMGPMAPKTGNIINQFNYLQTPYLLIDHIAAVKYKIKFRYCFI